MEDKNEYKNCWDSISNILHIIFVLFLFFNSYLIKTTNVLLSGVLHWIAAAYSLYLTVHSPARN